MQIFREMDPIIAQINDATLQYERFWRERVLAFVLQGWGYNGFPFKPKYIWLKSRKQEPLDVTAQRIANISFSYVSLQREQIVQILSNTKPASSCRTLWHTRIANIITASGCREEGNLFDFFSALQRAWQETTSRQEKFLMQRNLGKKSKDTLSLLLQEWGIDPAISWAEVKYFRQQEEQTITQAKQ